MPLKIRIEPVLPPRNFVGSRMGAVVSAIEAAIQGPIESSLIRAFQKRVAGWRDAPDFESTFHTTVNQAVLTVMPGGRYKKIWIFVSGGTEGHPITTKSPGPSGRRHSRSRRGLLRIKGGVGGYSPRTRPGNFYGGPGAYSGVTFYTPSVQHPGIEAREFESHIAQEETPGIINELNRAVNRALA